jgi:hypothetical protein
VITVTDAASNAGNVNVSAFTIVKPKKLNDTGSVLCGDYADGYSGVHNNDVVCTSAGATRTTAGYEMTNGNDIVPAGQDAHYGRDVGSFTSSSADGYKGFSFTKLDANGAALPASATSWSCVKDNVTGLIWEVKTDDGGVQDKDNSYNFAAANTYVTTVNGSTLCGASDWRLPTSEELLSIVHYGTSYPAIDSNYMPNTQASHYWTSIPGIASQTVNTVRFDFGTEAAQSETGIEYVRLVRQAP